MKWYYNRAEQVKTKQESQIVPSYNMNKVAKLHYVIG